MNNEQYLKKLKQALSALDKEERENILREISSYADDSNDSLFDRLGSPEELAQQYLDGTPPSLPLAKKAWSIGKKVLMGFGATVIILVTLGVIAVWQLSKDDFNYADTQHKELNIQGVEWKHLEVYDPITLNINQAKTVIYSHDDNRLSWNCKGESDLALEENVLKLRHNSCLVFLPQQKHHIIAEQSSIVIVEPKADLTIKAQQAEIQLAEGDNTYQYDIKGDRYKTYGDLLSNDSADVEITIEVFESTVKPYKY